MKKDEPIEVGEGQYKHLCKVLAGRIFHRKDGHQYFIKVFYNDDLSFVIKYLATHNADGTVK